MREEKVAQFFPKVAQKAASAVSTEIVTFFKVAKKLNGYLGYFCIKFEPKAFTKIALIW